ncbi:hypothetical protein AS859_09035 [Aliarcobacter cryaerophilus]|uniref:Uncharacterized protein n=1 Tax=Aliarcobacter cryaerophilus TaxID=28198 RepID=A0A1V9V9V5_9BACT|nr:hypothetical protein AS859_09035 [Aliarcobacter cryaerophilus]
MELNLKELSFSEEFSGSKGYSPNLIVPPRGAFSKLDFKASKFELGKSELLKIYLRKNTFLYYLLTFSLT